MLPVDGLALALARGELSARRLVRDALRGVACVAAFVAAAVLSAVPIEAVQVGDRVLTPGTAATGAELPTEVDPATWARVRYVVDDGSGARDLLLVDALLPLGEIERLGLGTPGAAVIADAGEAMPAWVVEVLPCPLVASGPGAVVLTTYSHLTAELLELRLPGGDRIGLTPDQYLLSADADGWVSADVVRAGDRLRTAGGDAALASVKVARETAWVHDLEVESEHAYLVGETGLVAHNSCGVSGGRGVGKRAYEKPTVTPLTETPTSKPGKRKFEGSDKEGPMRVRVERAHADDPSYTGPVDPLHTVDHVHIDRRTNGATGAWQSDKKVELPYPFDDAP